MSDSNWWLGAVFGFFVGVGFVASLLFVDQWQRRRR